MAPGGLVGEAFSAVSKHDDVSATLPQSHACPIAHARSFKHSNRRSCTGNTSGLTEIRAQAMAMIRSAMEIDPARTDYKCTLHLNMRKVSIHPYFGSRYLLGLFFWVPVDAGVLFVCS
eukprot:722734-Rhodomonas_salina.4